ncbi:MAG: alcohol dehydrogenase catalytic domain-containing protein, partial [Bacteroidales bacterium]|nr:alcohol dehydrogenase catalytic domain-containing protein [Bacteroidales bacterium]
MKAITIPAPQQMTVVEMPKPEPKAGEVLLKLEYVGFCGSDLNTFLGRNTMAKENVIPGHEIGAVIESVGEGCPENLQPGMVVTEIWFQRRVELWGEGFSNPDTRRLNKPLVRFHEGT